MVYHTSLHPVFPVPSDGEPLYLNLVPGAWDGDLGTVEAFHLPVTPQPHVQEAAFRSALARIGYRLERQYGGIAAPYASGILYVGEEPGQIDGDPSGTIGRPKRISLISSQHRKGLESLLNRELRRAARNLGYLKSGPNYVRAAGFTTRTSTGGVPLELNRDGFAARVFLSNGLPFLSLDLHAAIRRPIPLLVDYLKQKGVTEAEIEDRLLGRNVSTRPYGLTGVIRGLSWTSVGDFVIEDLGQTLYEYWEKRGEPVDPEEAPVVEVFLKHRRRSAHYPPSQVNLSLRGVSLPSSERLQIRPAERARRIADHPLLDKPLTLADCSLSFPSVLTPIERLKELGAVESMGLVTSPELLFGDGSVGSNPKDVLRWGPVDGAVTIKAIYAGGPDFPLEALHQSLAMYFQKWGFGRLELTKGLEIEDSRRGYYRGGQEAAQILQDIGTGTALIVGVLNGSKQGYGAFKQGIAQKMGGAFHAVQMVRRPTALDIIAGKQWLAADLLSQAYVKATRNPAWTLSKPAGGISGNAFLAFDVSRRQEFLFEERGEFHPASSIVRKEASAIASVCDDFGRVIEWDSYPSHSGETLGQDEAWSILTRTMDKVIALRGDDFRRLVVYKDGPIRDAELTFLRSAAESAIDDSDTEGQHIQIDLFGVVKSGLDRIFSRQEGAYANPERGTYVILPGGRALLCASQPWKGTTRPIRLEYRASVGGDRVPMTRVVREFSDLSHLDWRSLYLQPKSPLILQLVQSLGELLTADIETPTYIPL